MKRKYQDLKNTLKNEEFFVANLPLTVEERQTFGLRMDENEWSEFNFIGQFDKLYFNTKTQDQIF